MLKTTKLSPLTMFHLVLAMSDCEKDEIDLIYEHCLLKITACLKYEQLRRGYVRAETELILNLRDNMQRTAESNSDLNSEILKISTLAKSIKQVYDALQGKSTNHLVINHSARLSIQTNLEILRLLGKPIVGGTLKTPMPSLRPYHGLLLLQVAEDIIKTLLPDSSTLLIRFIQTVTPNTSFEQLQTILDCTLSQIYRMAAHLHFWGQARVIQSTLQLFSSCLLFNCSDIHS